MEIPLSYDLRNAFDTERKILMYCGFYPNEGRMNKFFYYLSGFYHFSISVLIQLSMTVLIALYITSLSTIAEVLLFFMTQAAFLSKLFMFIIKKDRLSKMEEILSNPIFYKLSNGNFDTVTNYIASTKTFAVCFRISCFLVCAMNVILPLLSSKDQAMLLGWEPWEVADDAFKYYLNRIFQLKALFVSAYVNSTIDVLVYMLITIATALIEILKINLVKIQYDEENAKKQFNENVFLHYEILRFVSVIEDTFSIGILSQIFASVLVICFTGFQMIIVSIIDINSELKLIYLIRSLMFLLKVYNSYLSLIYFMCMMCQVALYCWFGHYLIASSDAIIESIYMSNWYESDLSLRRSILIFMERCKKPIILKAGYLFPLSLETFTS
ncbi:hypothetical protein NQ318_022710, partial [Aromia moschata]